MTKPKRTFIAYALWLVIGGAGAHRFYLRKFRSGWAIIAYQCTAIAADELWWRFGDHERVSPDTLFWATMIPIGILLIHDAFRIPEWIDDWNNPFPDSPVEFLK